MKNILVITLGNSEIQIPVIPSHGFRIVGEEKKELVKEGLPSINIKENRNYHDFILLASPRNDGKLVSEHYEDFKDILQYPLITPLLEYLSKNKLSFDEVWWVFTNQEKEELHFQSNDTLHYRTILQKYFQERFPSVTYKDYAITEEVKNIDSQYTNFYGRAMELLKEKEEIANIYLLPQGGIDQINHALTLQLIQLFKEKVHIYQCAEKSEVVELQFTHLFLSDLTKQNIIKHIRDYDFDKATGLIFSNQYLSILSDYAAKRLSLLHKNIDDADVEEAFKINWSSLSFFEQNKIKLTDLVYAFKIQMFQGKYNEALIKLFVVAENMYKLWLDKFYNEDISFYFNRELRNKDDINEPWRNFLKINFGEKRFNELIKKKVNIVNPNTYTYAYLFRWLISDKGMKFPLNEVEIKRMHGIIEDLKKERNDIAHNLGAITKEEIEGLLARKNSSIEELYSFVDTIVETESFGIFNEIQQRILNFYGESA